MSFMVPAISMTIAMSVPSAAITMAVPSTTIIGITVIRMAVIIRRTILYGRAVVASIDNWRWADVGTRRYYDRNRDAD